MYVLYNFEYLYFCQRLKSRLVGRRKQLKARPGMQSPMQSMQYMHAIHELYVACPHPSFLSLNCMIASRLSLHSIFFPLEEKKVEIHAIHAINAIHAIHAIQKSSRLGLPGSSTSGRPGSLGGGGGRNVSISSTLYAFAFLYHKASCYALLRQKGVRKILNRQLEIFMNS